MILMARDRSSKNTIFVAPTNIVHVYGTKADSFGLSNDEREVIMYVRDHGGKVPEARVVAEVKTGSDVNSCIEKLVSYEYAIKDKSKIVLTNNGEYVAQAFRMETVKYK